MIEQYVSTPWRQSKKILMPGHLGVMINGNPQCDVNDRMTYGHTLYRHVHMF